MVYQIVDKMLPYPLFGSERNIAPAKNVENLHPLAGARQFHVERWQVELRCLFVCHCSPGVGLYFIGVLIPHLQNYSFLFIYNTKEGYKIAFSARSSYNVEHRWQLKPIANFYIRR